jgi:hypothetical protein
VGWSICGKIFFAFVDGLDIDLLLLGDLLLEDDLLHVAPALGGLVGRFVALLFLLTLLLEFEFLGLLLLADLVLALLVLLDLLLDLADELRVQFLLPLDHRPQSLDLVLDFLHR